MPRVVKSDRSREPFDEHKLRARHASRRSRSARSARRRSSAAVAASATSCGCSASARCLARTIGEFVMEELRHLDEVAYVRFASVYRSFQDIEAFREEIERLRHHRRRREEKRDQDQLPLLPGEAATRSPKRMSTPTQRRAAHGERDYALHAARARAGRARACTPPIRIRASAACWCATARVVGEGWHERAGEPHAEVQALRRGGSRRRTARPPT